MAERLTKLLVLAALNIMVGFFGAYLTVPVLFYITGGGREFIKGFCCITIICTVIMTVFTVLLFQMNRDENL